jgi:transporter family protein
MDRSFLFAIAASLVWGLAPALEKMGLKGNIDPYAGVVIRTVAIAFLAIVGLLFMGRLASFKGLDLKAVFFIAAGGIVAGFIGQLAFYSALKHGEASVVVPVAATYPLVALIVSIVFLGEAFTWQKAVGISLVVIGVALVR